MSDANAHLIAAAPELYEALEQLLEYFVEAHQEEMEDMHGGDAKQNGEDPDGCSYCEQFAVARRAMAKARGEV
jgi:hypothetical protein